MFTHTKIQPLCILLLFLLFLANKAVAEINPAHRVEQYFVGVTTISVSYSYNYILDQNKNRRDSLNFKP